MSVQITPLRQRMIDDMAIRNRALSPGPPSAIRRATEITTGLLAMSRCRAGGVAILQDDASTGWIGCAAEEAVELAEKATRT